MSVLKNDKTFRGNFTFPQDVFCAVANGRAYQGASSDILDHFDEFLRVPSRLLGIPLRLEIIRPFPVSGKRQARSGQVDIPWTWELRRAELPRLDQNSPDTHTGKGQASTKLWWPITSCTKLAGRTKNSRSLTTAAETLQEKRHFFSFLPTGRTSLTHEGIGMIMTTQWSWLWWFVPRDIYGSWKFCFPPPNTLTAPLLFLHLMNVCNSSKENEPRDKHVFAKACRNNYFWNNSVWNSISEELFTQRTTIQRTGISEQKPSTND